MADQAAQPFFEERQLFEPGEEGYPIFRIPGLVTTRTGTLIAYAEARSVASDWATIDLVVKRSTDGGRTWGPLQIAVRNKPGETITYNNPVMIAERDSDTVHFLFCKNYHEVFYMKSEDEGRSWSEPRNLAPTVETFRSEAQRPAPYPWKVIAVGPGHGIALRNGRLLAPVWLANGETDRDHGPSVIATIYSDDRGETWKAGEIIFDTPLVPSPNETTAVELEDGSVMLNIRSLTKKRTVTVSPDGASRWAGLRLDETLTDPVNFGSLARYSFKEETGASRILFVNANDPEHRRNITLRMSEDEGNSWKYSRVIQPEQGAYAEVGVSKDGMIHVLYERQYGIKAVRLNLAWLTGGTDQES